MNVHSLPLPGRKRPLRIASLFTGIGGHEAGLRGALGARPFQTVLTAEMNPLAMETYLANHPAPRHRLSDVRDVPSVVGAGRVDLLFASPPCQPWSMAGKMGGAADPRGWAMFQATLDSIRHLAPGMVLIENVAPLATHRRFRFILNRVLRELRKLGYVVRHGVLDSLAFGVPQRRRRLWIVGFRADLYPGAASFRFPSGTGERATLAGIVESVGPDDPRYAEVRANPGLARNPRYLKRAARGAVGHFNCLTRTLARKGSSDEYVGYVCEIHAATGEFRGPTVRECARAHGFPDGFVLPASVRTNALLEQMANTVSPAVVAALVSEMLAVAEAGADRRAA